MSIGAELLDILACPKCKGGLEQVNAPEGFGCRACNLLYKTEDGIPNFLIDEAVAWGADNVAEKGGGTNDKESAEPSGGESGETDG